MKCTPQAQNGKLEPGFAGGWFEWLGAISVVEHLLELHRPGQVVKRQTIHVWGARRPRLLLSPWSRSGALRFRLVLDGFGAGTTWRVAGSTYLNIMRVICWLFCKHKRFWACHSSIWVAESDAVLWSTCIATVAWFATGMGGMADGSGLSISQSSSYALRYCSIEFSSFRNFFHEL